eukprot:TRINITY_DN7064_c0_g1_i3.p1 TRINITY_DN7064_c0_g1~~TRINITY_DN7064_c0_g1_i3.p1  ORF type:complete len:187 (+),score=29.39 TRINITY_DN7064_c0_g1_i3:448-1008(+)
MIDTGCSSLLLPLKSEQLSSLALSFPHPTFLWSIGGSIGVGSLNAVTLIVKRPGHTFDCSLNSSSILPIPFLRFHLCLEDVKWLEQNCTWLDNNSCEKLQVWKDTTEKVKNIGVKCGERRTQALLGQIILSKYACYESEDLFVAMPSFPDVVLRLLNTPRLRATREVAQLEQFDDLTEEGDDNDGE